VKPPSPAAARVGIEEVRAAAERLRGRARITPVERSSTLDAEVGHRIFLKCEQLQRSGAFKFRGAYNALARLREQEDHLRGVLSYSSGNHAQALALAGRLLGVPVTIVMPRDATRAKLEATRGYGAEIVLYDRRSEQREEVAERLRGARGLALIPPYDHPDVVAGQGTAALELLEETGPLDLLIAPCGGGGLLAGSAVAAAALAPACRVVGAEPVGADDAARSLRDGALRRSEQPDTVADGLRTPSLGELTFDLLRAHGAAVETVPDAATVAAMRYLWSRMKLVVEPSGAIGLGLLRHAPPPGEGLRVGIILSGGNVDLEAACALFAGR
jgi:threo-3-hydroxy-L-aspartate ammonia-lyase